MTILGYILLIVPGIIVTGLFALAPIACVDQRLGFADSFKWCLDRVKPHLWGMFGLVFLAGIVSGLGFIACCVGILFTAPVYPIVLGLTYDTFQPLAPATAVADGLRAVRGGAPGRAAAGGLGSSSTVWSADIPPRLDRRSRWSPARARSSTETRTGMSAFQGM